MVRSSDIPSFQDDPETQRKYLDYLRDTAETNRSGRRDIIQAEIAAKQLSIDRVAARAEYAKGKSQLMNSKTARRQDIKQTAALVWPIISTILFIYFVIGPGGLLILKLATSVEWYWWAALIFGGLILWRNR